jgi:hypothetical protein
MITKISGTEATMLTAFFVGCLFSLIVVLGIFDLWAYWITGLSILVIW